MSIVSAIESPGTLLFLMCLMSFIFQMTIGPLAPLYAAEVCTDVGLGAVMVCEDIFTLIQVFITPGMLDSGLGHVGSFAIYAIAALCGVAFVYFYVPETKGLTEKEKKEMFLPGQKWGRKLRDDESRYTSDSDQLNSEKLSQQLRAAREKQATPPEPKSSKSDVNLHLINDSLLSSGSSLTLDKLQKANYE
mmetsp:Transcript_14901/g.20186  ORF Transcript_14901/g.20186 Transcript_14901/m.20186 type:complete len:191 (+) Transcript_14901:1307-1879(+)